MVRQHRAAGLECGKGQRQVFLPSETCLVLLAQAVQQGYKGRVEELAHRVLHGCKQGGAFIIRL